MEARRDDVVEEVRSRVDIVDVVSDVVTLRRAGKSYVGLCPFHEEDTPSFHVSPDRQMFYCFGCQKGGDVFTFVMEQRGLDFRQALEMLAERAGITLPERALTPEQRRLQERRRRLLDALERAARYFENLLQRSPGAEAARRYVRERGLEPATLEAFRLGWSDPEWETLTSGLRQRGVPDDVLVEAGLGVRRDDGSLYDRFRGRLMFPILDERGRVIAFGGRAFGDDQPKYLNSPETPLFHKSRVLYALDRARGPMRQHGRALIVEGYMDAVTAHQAGFDFAVASLGTALSADQARTVTRYASRVYIAYDADAAGEQATLRGLEHFARLGVAAGVHIVRMPSGHDPDSFIRERGAAAFQELIDRAQPLVDYVFDRALAEHEAGRPEGKGQVVRAVAPWWASLDSAVVRSDYVRRFAERLGVDESSLRAELARLVGRRRSERRALPGSRTARGPRDSGAAPGRHKSPGAGGTIRVQGGRSIHRASNGPMPGHVRAERELLRILMHHPERAAAVLRQVAAEEFTDARAREVAEAVAALARAGMETAVGDEMSNRKDWTRLVFDNVSSDGARTLVGALVMEGPPPGDVDAVLRDCIQRMERSRMERRAEELRAAILEQDRAGQEVPGELLLEYEQLQRRLRGTRWEGG